jgi:6-phosphogluconolactonase
MANAAALAETVAGLWLAEVAAARERGAPHCVALSGGRITPRFFAAVHAQNRARDRFYDRVHFFWADERCVPPTDPESNFRMASEGLLAPLHIAAGQIHRLRGEEEPEAAARAAAAELSGLAPANAAGLPVLDLVLLGMGEDGHVASLFPGAGAEVLNATAPFLVVRDSPKPPPVRLTLSYAALAAARQIWVLVVGAGKENALRDALSPDGQTPLHRVLALHPGTQIFTDLNLNPPDGGRPGPESSRPAASPRA